ncbi:s-adenosyl-l-methionine-dependent methyltransferase [Lucifera butyrica]|uniref:S-adenosyl-l-methionine-dependent methyltransferase n=1 Tax=Lucifera butyrica TaxID=1351585 RepID=A0A498R326_9FIRM|nr:CmcI family methyltransferase [Lucifera butyrica]VBB05180.1 s-adenosyl-l-methionine-dependent methyltransferase [Lucifera butyrica]
MKLIIDTDLQTVCCQNDNREYSVPLYSREAFELLSRWWVKIGWNEKYEYTFSWLGRPIIQLPEDMVRIQEVLYRIKPDVIIETGVAHGGSLIYYAGLCKVMGNGRVVGIDIDIRPHNRRAIEEHELASYITLIEGDSTASAVLTLVKSNVQAGETVAVILDSCHTQKHVAAELEAYAPLVSPGSYIIVTDGIMQELFDTPRGNPEWQWDNPGSAVEEFLQIHPEFICERPAWVFNESQLAEEVTNWPKAWLKRLF